MDVYQFSAEESPRKIRRLNNSDKVATKSSQTKTASLSADTSAIGISSSQNADPLGLLGSSFNFSNHIPASSPEHFIVDITKYIPVGCLRMHREETEIDRWDWESCKVWQAFPHQKDLDHKRGGRYLNKELQLAFFGSPALKPYIGIHKAGWVRMEFKANNSNLGQIRVYILPDDVGRGHIERDNTLLRKAHKLLLSNLDIFYKTWEGEWDIESPFIPVDPAQGHVSKKELSLFEIFDSLPSPKPTPEIVTDVSVRRAMSCIVGSDIPGLLTPLYSYQRRSAALMLQREYYPGQIMDPRLIPEFDQKGAKWFCDLDSGLCFRDVKTFEGVRGGICAETMGLGKTLICLALILASRHFSSQIPVEYSVDSVPVRKKTGSLLDMSASLIGRTGLLWKDEIHQIEEAEGYKFDRCREAIERGAGHYSLTPSSLPRRTSRSAVEAEPRKIWLCTSTIVVVPANLVRQWQSEIRKHTTGLDVLTLFYPSDKLPTARALSKYDIILFSKARFDQEAKPRDEEYHSPLKDLHFKRLIVDEGHNFGNSGSSSKTMAVEVVESLQLEARWIVSGTPTQGLGALRSSNDSNTKLSQSDEDDDNILSLENTGQMSDMSIKQERRDIEKLGNIATNFLRARPWALSSNDKDRASWNQIVMQPRHGSKSRGNMNTLRFTLEGMIIKHRPEDVVNDVELPQLHQNFVYLDGSIQNKLSLNVFSFFIIVNAITSERKDADYFFHSRQRKHLNTLVSNLRQASFFWSGTTGLMVYETIKNARRFLEERKVPITPEDEALLLRAIDVGENILTNEIWRVISEWHELPMYLENKFSASTRSTLSLLEEKSDPTLAGTTTLLAIQQHVNSQLWKPDPADGLSEAIHKAMKTALRALEIGPNLRGGNKDKSLALGRKAHQPASSLDVPTTGSNNTDSRKRNAPSTSTSTAEQQANKEILNLVPTAAPTPLALPPLKSALKKSTNLDISPSIDPNSPLASTQAISSASAKLSYLMDKISLHHKKEKILVFYESDNVAYYIAQALELLGIQHLIYAKGLSPTRLSQYVVSFNSTETFRVLLMDVSLAAFGLNMSSASRLFFVNPVFSPQIEAQAIKRAHRIGQTKPVFVETLVLKDSVEELIVKRREAMSSEEHKECKSILDDEIIYNWIRNVNLIPIPSNKIPGPDQMSKLDSPHLLFGNSGLKSSDPDADLILSDNDSEGEEEEQKEEEEEPQPPTQPPITLDPWLIIAPQLSLEISLGLGNIGEGKEGKEEAEVDCVEEVQFEPVDVPGVGDGREREIEGGEVVEDNDWEVPVWENSGEELDI